MPLQQRRIVACCSVLVSLIADTFRPHLANSLVQEGLNKIKKKFASPDHVGPAWVARFEEIDDAEARVYRKWDTYERVTELLARLGIIGPDTP